MSGPTDLTAIDLSMQNVADLLGIHQSTVTRMAQRGALTRYRAANGAWRIPFAEVERLLAAFQQERQGRTDRARALDRLRAQLRRSA